MFRHFSLRGIRAAIAAVAAIARAHGTDPSKLPPIDIPSELQGKRRKGMSALSGFARWRGCCFRGYRWVRASGPMSYDEASPNKLLRERRQAERDAGNFIGPHGQFMIRETNV